jgi:hypothetical protein
MGEAHLKMSVTSSDVAGSAQGLLWGKDGLFATKRQNMRAIGSKRSIHEKKPGECSFENRGWACCGARMAFFVSISLNT